MSAGAGEPQPLLLTAEPHDAATESVQAAAEERHPRGEAGSAGLAASDAARADDIPQLGMPEPARGVDGAGDGAGPSIAGVGTGAEAGAGTAGEAAEGALPLSHACPYRWSIDNANTVSWIAEIYWQSGK